MIEFLCLERFAEKRPIPMTIEVSKTLWERVKSYLPWSWSSNHKTKWIIDPKAPRFIKWRRPIPFTHE